MMQLPYPHKALWPNGRSHWAEKARQVKKHRKWAYMASVGLSKPNVSPVRLKITVCPKARGPVPDQDNVVAACKSYIDGIADSLGLNDREFAAPIVEFSSVRKSQFVLEIVS